MFKKLYPDTLFSRKALGVAVLILAMLPLSSCDLARNTLKHDRDANLEFQDMRDGLAARDPVIEDEEKRIAGIPGLRPYIAAPSENLKPMPLVSISVNQSVPLRDVLYELAQQAEYDLELDPRIRGSIIFSARNRPLDMVIERIADISGLRYKFEDDILRVEMDTPYNKLYRIDYLSYIRRNAGSVRNSIAVVSGEGADTGSQFEATSESVSDFWGELENNLQQMVERQSTGQLRTDNSPEISAVDQNPDVAAVAPESEDGQVSVQAPDAVLQVGMLPVDDQFGTEGDEDGEGDGFSSSFTINRQAGIVSVFTTERIHKQIEEYLKELRKSVTAQVLIEARILEVTLEDQHTSGINWQAIGLAGGEGVLQFGNLTTLAGGAPQASNEFAIGFLGNDVQALINTLSLYGSVRALASPRLTVLNNQSAMLNVATNRVFFEIDIDVTTNDNTTQTDVDSEIRNVPEGVIVNVQPSIDLERGTISMAVRPTITSVVREVSDPAVAFAAGNNNVDIDNRIPEVNVQEIDSVISMRSGQPVVMGGLLQDRIQVADSGVPVLGELPIMGNLFKTNFDLIEKTELVIFLKATIVEGGDNVHATDKDLYRKFSGDRRPMKF